MNIIIDEIFIRSILKIHSFHCALRNLKMYKQMQKVNGRFGVELS